MFLFLIFALCTSLQINFQKDTKVQQRDFKGTYTFDCWGADGGGSASNPTTRSKGAFISAKITFSKTTRLYFFVGESPDPSYDLYRRPISNTDTFEYSLPGGLCYGGSPGTVIAKAPEDNTFDPLFLSGGGGGFTAISLSEQEDDAIIIVGSGGGTFRHRYGSPGAISQCLTFTSSGGFFSKEPSETACLDSIYGGNGTTPGVYSCAGGGAGKLGGPAGNYTNNNDSLWTGFGIGGTSFMIEKDDPRLTAAGIEIEFKEALNGFDLLQSPYNTKEQYHGTFIITKMLDCNGTPDPECQTEEDCLCLQCKANCERCNPKRCSQCKSDYKYDEENDRCYVDSEPFSDSFDFTVSEDFTKSFNFNATDVFSPTRSEKVIVVPENNTTFIIIGCAVGGVVVIAAVVIVLIIFIRRRKQLPFTSNADEDSMKETVIPLQEDQLTIDDSSDSSMLSQHGDDPFLPVNYQNDILTE